MPPKLYIVQPPRPTVIERVAKAGRWAVRMVMVALAAILLFAEHRQAKKSEERINLRSRKPKDKGDFQSW